MADFGDIVRVTARKPHRCEWCLGPIPKGESHLTFRGIWEGAWQNWRMHDECYADSGGDEGALMDGFIAGDGEMPPRVAALLQETRP